jgi:hypothetical protein
MINGRGIQILSPWERWPGGPERGLIGPIGKLPSVVFADTSPTGGGTFLTSALSGATLKLTTIT